MLRPANRRPRPPLVLLAATVALVALTATGCAPPTPTPTPTPLFASEAEAFAAAEETYRGYVDAFNRVNLRDPDTFEPLYEYTASAYQNDERRSLQQLYADGHMRSGNIDVKWFRGERFDSDEVTASVCTDVSRTEYRDRDGVSLAAPNRRPLVAIRLVFRNDGQSLKIFAGDPIEDPSCAP